MTIPLKNLQAVFKEYLTGQDESICDHIVSTEGLANDARLAIYGNAYVSRLVEALEEDFPSIKAVLGESDFVELCQQYIQQYPSTFPSLRHFGQYLPEFLLHTGPYKDKPYLFELALLEWSFIDAFDAVDTKVAGDADVAQIQPELWPVMKMIIHPSVQVFEYRWNILPVWRASADGETLPALMQLPEKETCLVWRQGLSTQYRTMATDESTMMDICRRGGTFAEICETLAETMEDEQEVPMKAASYIKTWLSQGIISDFKTES